MLILIPAVDPFPVVVDVWNIPALIIVPVIVVSEAKAVAVIVPVAVNTPPVNVRAPSARLNVPSDFI